jgi:hypothetical protein
VWKRIFFFSLCLSKSQFFCPKAHFDVETYFFCCCGNVFFFRASTDGTAECTGYAQKNDQYCKMPASIPVSIDADELLSATHSIRQLVIIE